MDYWKLKKRLGKSELRRAVPRLEALRAQLSAEIPPKDADDNLLLATWNIRDLGKAGGGYGYGERLPESYFYIAEILSRFDFVAVQEVNQLSAWEHVMDALGPHWGFIASDVTDKDLGGNGERLTYLYDKRKVDFRNIAGEIVLPPSMLVSENVVAKPGDKPKSKKLQLEKAGKQFARSPYFASFRAGWRKFDICTVHIYYGEEHGPALARRIDEIHEIAAFLGKRAKESTDDGRALILLGDFNIVGIDHETMAALLGSGFVVPKNIQEPPGNQRNNYYDQIAFRTPPDALFFPKEDDEKGSGSFRIYQHIFSDEDRQTYARHFEPIREEMNAKAQEKAKAKGKKPPKPTGPAEFFDDWRTWQLSDHQPLWVRLKANDSDSYLKSLLTHGTDA